MSCSAPGVFILRERIWCSALLSSQPLLIRHPPSTCLRRALMLILSRTECTGMIPSALRSSGHSIMPAAIACAGLRISMGCSSMNTCPPVMRVPPNSPFINSLRPAPTRPNRPTISPLRTDKLTGARTPGAFNSCSRSRSAPQARGCQP